MGRKDPRHLWPAFRRLINRARPAIIFGEQVASADGRHWLNGVFANLETMAYAAAGADLCAAGVGAPHIRQRLWWMAYANGNRCHQTRPCVATSGSNVAIGNRRSGGVADAKNSNGGANSNRENRPQTGGADLQEIALLAGWPTCSSRDWKDSPGMSTTGTNPDGTQRTRLDQLPRVAQLAGWATPRAEDAESAGMRHSRGVADTLSAQVGQDLTSSPAGTEKRGALNPAHSRWLMGFPAVWDSCGATAMQSCQKSPRNSSRRALKPSPTQPGTE